MSSCYFTTTSTVLLCDVVVKWYGLDTQWANLANTSAAEFEANDNFRLGMCCCPSFLSVVVQLVSHIFMLCSLKSSNLYKFHCPPRLVRPYTRQGNYVLSKVQTGFMYLCVSYIQNYVVWAIK